MRLPTIEQATDLKNRFTYHKSGADELAFYVQCRSQAWDLAGFITANLPPSRETSLAITKLEEAVMWANAARSRMNADGSRKMSR